MFENLLPVGSVVLLKNALKKSVIIGYKQVGSKDPGRIFDYSGIIYPVGNFGPQSQFLFDQDDIQDVIFVGYKNDEFNDMVAALEKKATEDASFAEAMRTKKAVQNNQ